MYVCMHACMRRELGLLILTLPIFIQKNKTPLYNLFGTGNGFFHSPYFHLDACRRPRHVHTDVSARKGGRVAGVGGQGALAAVREKFDNLCVCG